MSSLLNGRVTSFRNNATPTASVEMIGPAEAAKLLEGNEHNYRKLKPPIVSRYAFDMEQGLWTLTTGAIGVDVNGNLTNGQHRLNAVIQSGVTCMFIVVRNLPVGSCEDPNEDTGSRRSVATHLQNMGVANANCVAATARFLWGLKSSTKTIKRSRHGLSDAMVAKLVASDERIIASTSATDCVKNIATPSVASSWHWIASFDDEQLANECVGVLAAKVDCSTMHPFAKLRDVILQARSDKKNKGGMTADLQFRYFMSAWTKAKSNDPVKLLRPVATIKIPDAADYALQVLGQ
jgi:hypothetical protein